MNNVPEPRQTWKNASLAVGLTLAAAAAAMLACSRADVPASSAIGSGEIVIQPAGTLVSDEPVYYPTDTPAVETPSMPTLETTSEPVVLEPPLRRLFLLPSPVSAQPGWRKCAVQHPTRRYA